MNYLSFEDDELNDLYNAVNNLQFCFHPTYAPQGKFSIKHFVELPTNLREIMILTDKNFVSPICEISTKGTLKDKVRLQKVALFVTFSNYLNARVTCGMGLLENDTSGICNTSGEEVRLQFLHGVDSIPPMIWKDIAFGYRDSVPAYFLYKGEGERERELYDLDNNFLLLSNELATAKIVEILRSPAQEPINQFINFMNWYADNLDIAESVVIYAALVFANIPNVASPKKAKSRIFSEVEKGIKNQAWDLTYIVTWSQFYYKENQKECYMFATDDITQKNVVVNIIPPGEWAKALEAIFRSKKQQKKLNQFIDSKLGEARIRPFLKMTEEEKTAKVNNILAAQYKTLKNSCDTE